MRYYILNLLFYLHHPAHFHLFKNVINNLEKLGHKVSIIATPKDVLMELLDDAKMDYYKIIDYNRKANKVAIATSLLIQDLRLFKYCRRNKPDLLLGTSTEICHIGSLLNIPSLFFNEDDVNVVKMVGYLAYPFASKIVCPTCCDVGNWRNKAIKYEGYHELAYLHPKYFKPDLDVVKKYFPNNGKYYMIRFAKLEAHHDSNVRGIECTIASKLIDILMEHGEVLITSERQLEPQFEKYRIQCSPAEIHHFIANASLLIGDSQTMSAEAGVLGVPFIRYNDFVGKIGCLDELENKYELGYGITPDDPQKLLETTKHLVTDTLIQKKWSEKREYLLRDKIDVTSYFTDLIDKYPCNLT